MQKGMGARAVLGIALAFCVSGCVTLPPGHTPPPQDPWESWNRGVYKFNDSVDRAVVKPLARGYVKVVPSPARTGVSNFFTNLHTTTTMVNDALQGKFGAAANDLARFVVNTTIGVGGLLDPASQMGLDKNDEDFGQTLGHYGVKSGPFVELPILGPSDARDAPAKGVDIFTGPTHYISNSYVSYGLYGLQALDTRVALLPLDSTLQRVFDPYAFIRDAYLQRRAYLVSDGKGTDEAPLVDPGLDEPSEAVTPPPPPGAPPKQNDEPPPKPN
ncbi:MAG TPA: VacJ family lipoprotein [Steroidobacteraceae bacterium]